MTAPSSHSGGDAPGGLVTVGEAGGAVATEVGERKPPADEWDTVTTKILTSRYDLYLHVSWDGPRAVHVALFVGSCRDDTLLQCVGESEALSDQVRFMRASLEVITRHASELLRSGAWTLEDLCEAWRGTAVYHGGVIRVDMRHMSVSGPLDAAARVIEQRLGEWSACRTSA